MFTDRFTSPRPQLKETRSSHSLGLRVAETALAISLALGTGACSLVGGKNEPAPTRVTAKAPVLGPAFPPTPDSRAKTPIAKEGLSDRERQEIIKQILNTHNYSSTRVDTLVALAKIGNSQSTIVEAPNDNKLFVAFSSITEDTAPAALSGTDVRTGTIGELGKEVFNVSFGISIGADINQNFPPSVREALIRREATGAQVAIVGLTTFFRLKGIDLTQPMDSQLASSGITSSQMSHMINDLGAILEQYQNLLSRFQDAIGLMPLVDRNLNQRDVLSFRSSITPNGLSVPSPVIGGRVYGDNGKLYQAIDTLGGSTVSGFSDIGRVSEKYPSFNDIPNWRNFVSQITGN